LIGSGKVRLAIHADIARAQEHKSFTVALDFSARLRKSSAPCGATFNASTTRTAGVLRRHAEIDEIGTIRVTTITFRVVRTIKLDSPVIMPTFDIAALAILVLLLPPLQKRSNGEIRGWC
jgi:hypothetical protein